jgi:hypothetical protein
MTIAPSKTAMMAASTNAQPPQLADTETYSRNILGPVWFNLSQLSVLGTAGLPTPPEFVAPEQSAYIIAEDEKFVASLNIEFNKSPLSALLMCLGSTVTVNWHFEGQGRAATEFDLSASIVTEKDKYSYTVTLDGIPNEEGMTPGLYEVSATVEVGPAQHKCSQFVLGYGYISEVLLQVYPSV